MSSRRLELNVIPEAALRTYIRPRLSRCHDAPRYRDARSIELSLARAKINVGTRDVALSVYVKGRRLLTPEDRVNSRQTLGESPKMSSQHARRVSWV